MRSYVLTAAAYWVRARPLGKERRIDRRLLAIYLNDHFAGSALGLDLARRSLKNNRGTPLGAFLERLVREIADDRQTLSRVMDALGVRRSPIKPVLARAFERIGRLKLNGRLTSYSPLSRVLELEGLVMGVTGKRALWRALRELDAELPPLGGFDLDALERRADAELAELERHRLDAARLALAPAGAARRTASAG